MGVFCYVKVFVAVEGGVFVIVFILLVEGGMIKFFVRMDVNSVGSSLIGS